MKAESCSVLEDRSDGEMAWRFHAGGDRASVGRMSRSGTGEWHVMVATQDVADPCTALEQAWLRCLQESGIDPSTTLVRRVFSREPGMDAALLEGFRRGYPGLLSVVGQAPCGQRLALWSYHVTDTAKPVVMHSMPDALIMQRGSMRHLWTAGWTRAESGEVGEQSQALLEGYAERLATHGMNLEQHAVRTWWFLRDVDADYAALADVRRTFFHRHGLTERTHYLASTGIEGTPVDAAAHVALDAYAIDGLQPGQVDYPQAPDYLGPTGDYGVTFERATRISYADRRHLLISGTASIDPQGRIVHPGDVVRQFGRAAENFEALLGAAEAAARDLVMLLIYVRHESDGATVRGLCAARFPKVPQLVLHAPVCRPGWLVEIEGIAISCARIAEFPAF